MSIESMKSDIEAKTKQTIAQIRQEAKTEADRIAEEGRRMAEERKSRLSETLERELNERVSIEEAAEEVKGRRIIADLRQEAISNVLGDAEAALRSFVKKRDYEEMLDRLVMEAANGLDGDDLVLAANADDRELLKGLLSHLQREIAAKRGGKAALRLEDGTIDCIGGVVVYTRDHKRSFNNTLDARLTSCRNDAWEIARILFG